MSDDKHLVDPPLPSVRDSADALGIRLVRIGAAATTLRGLTDDLRDGSSLDALMSALDVVERDIVLASRQLLIVRQAAHDHDPR